MSVLDAPAKKSTKPCLLVQKLRRASANHVIQILGDSTGNEESEWVYQLALKLADDHPKYSVIYRLWNDGTQGYDTAQNISTGTTALTLTIYNGSKPGAGYDYAFQNANLTRWNAIFPVAATAVIVSYGYNSGDSTFFPALNELLDWVRGKAPLAEIVLTAQPPLATANAGNANSLLRSEDARAFAALLGLGCVDPCQRFLDYGNYDNLIESDQVHPNAAGKSLWFDEVRKYFDKQQCLVTPTSTIHAPNRIFVDFSRFAIHTGSPSIVLNSGVPAWAFDASTEEAVVALVDVPAEWNTWSAYLFWSAGGGTVAGVVLDLSYQAINNLFAVASSGHNLAGSYSSLGTITNNSTAAANSMRVHRALNAGRVTAGRPLALKVARLPANAGDAFAGDAHFYGLMLLRTS